MNPLTYFPGSLDLLARLERHVSEECLPCSVDGVIRNLEHYRHWRTALLDLVLEMDAADPLTTHWNTVLAYFQIYFNPLIVYTVQRTLRDLLVLAQREGGHTKES